ncbi:hypothetical protein DI392_17930 [Vibrio albus]|uniref:Uncharacterized protein n=1 Tax=Vibrio albus TaxID=2200953 RepID=A0A2U3B535_9VIBR|nr:hypothetical protein [Vibrio albus]PWI31911.1 hypothetical protein DI392_17930 [Vibrio albus]
MATKFQLLQQEVAMINRWMSMFDPSYPFNIMLPSPDSMIIEGFPLPSGIKPDRLELCLLLDNYPSESPIGLYIRDTHDNRILVKQIKEMFNVFQGDAYHGAPSINGYHWVCLHYGSASDWSFNPENLHKGDCIYKFLERFHIRCKQLN